MLTTFTGPGEIERHHGRGFKFIRNTTHQQISKDDAMAMLRQAQASNKLLKAKINDYHKVVELYIV